MQAAPATSPMVGGAARLSEVKKRERPLRQPDRAERVVEAARQCPCCPLHLQAQTMVADLMREGEGRLVPS